MLACWPRRRCSARSASAPRAAGTVVAGTPDTIVDLQRGAAVKLDAVRAVRMLGLTSC